MMEPAVNARIQDMRIVTKVSLSEETEFDGKSLSRNRWLHCLNIARPARNRAEKNFWRCSSLRSTPAAPV